MFLHSKISYLLFFISNSSSQMNMQIGIRNHYNIFDTVFKSLYPTIVFRKDHNGNTATLHFCVISTTALYIEYINIPVENFHLLLLIKVNLSGLPTYFERQY